jgi:hypothetical protein
VVDCRGGFLAVEQTSWRADGAVQDIEALNMASHAEQAEHFHGLLADVDLVDLECRLLLDEVRVALAPRLLWVERDAADRAARWRLQEPGGYLIFGV